MRIINMILANIICLFFAVWILSFFYWEVFHRVGIRALRFKLFAIRDEVRRVAVEKEIGNSKEFKDLERFICLTIALMPNISLLSFILSKTPKISAADVKEFEAFECQAPSEFLAARNKACKCAVTMMMLNSPWIIAIASFAIPPLWALGKISMAIIFRKTENFVGDLAPNLEVALPSANIA